MSALARQANRVELPEYAAQLWEPARHYAFYGGRGGAKSWAVADHLLISGAERTLRVGCAREIQDTIRDSVKRLLDDRIQALGLQGYYESTDKEIRGVRNDTLFIFKGLWRNPDGLKSMEGVDRVWVEEAARVSQRSIDLLIPTVRKEGSALIWTWNPEYDHDPVDRLFRGPAGPPPRSIVQRVSWKDNPWFPDVLREQLEHDYRADPDKADHVWGGDYIKAVEGAYYAKQLRAAREQGRFTHLPLDPNFAIRAYWDLGRNDATAIWICQFIDSRIVVLDYCEAVGQAPGYYFNWLRSNGYESAQLVLPHDGASIHPDNPVAMSYETQARNAGFQVKVIRNQGPGAAMQRIDAVRRLFPRMWFNEDQTRVGIRALGHYHERRNEERNVGLGPEHDWSSHCFTGDTKVLTRYGTQRIMDLPNQGEVLTPCGWKPYRNPRITRRNAPLVEVAFADGLTVKCTADHMFLTESGWKPAQSLQSGTKIQSTLTLSRSISTAVFTACGQAKGIFRAAVDGCTEMFGQAFSGLFPLAATSITRTKTSSTMPSTTWSYCPVESTFLTPANAKWRRGEKTSSRSQHASERQTGTDLRKDAFGTGATPSGQSHGQNGSAKIGLATIVSSHSAPWFGKAAIRNGIARVRARLLRIVKGVRAMNMQPRIAHVSALRETADVWCLTVPDDHCFSLENGAVVHNCADAFGLMAIDYQEPRQSIEWQKPIAARYGTIA